MINGVNLPYAFPPDQGVTATVTGDVLTITGNGSGTYNDVISVRYVSGGTTGTTTLTEAGTWFANGNAITCNDQTDNVVYQGSVSGNTLTQINGYTQVYTR